MDKVLRLIVIDNDPDEVRRLIHIIKAGDYAVRAQHVENEAQLAAALQTDAPDLMLCAMNTPSIGLEHVLAAARGSGRDVPVIGLADDDTADVVACMQEGAVDLVHKTRTDHLQLVIARTAEAQRQRREVACLTAALQASEQRCRSLLNSSRDPICYVREGVHLDANAAYLEAFGYVDLTGVDGTPIMDRVALEHQRAMKEALRRLEKEPGREDRLDVALMRVDGKTFDAKLEISATAASEGEPWIQIVIRDRGGTNQPARRAESSKQRDPATGLYSRGHFNALLEAAISDAGEAELNRALVQVDLDNLPAAQGVVGGTTDAVMADIARLLAGMCADDDALARLNEHSFGILTPRWRTDDLEPFLRRLSAALDNHTCEIGGQSIRAQACIGSVSLNAETRDVGELLARTETSCARARQGRATSAIASPSIDEAAPAQSDEDLASTLREALDAQRLRLLFQPIVSLRGDPGERYEVFVRGLDAAGAELNLAASLPSAERTGMAKELDRWVLTHAIDTLALEHASGRDMTFFVKLTAATLQDADLLPWLTDTLQDTRVPPGSLVFCVKEQVAVKYLKQAKALVKGLQDMRHRCAIDDFGTGLNPFQLLKTVPADYLKVHRSLMKNFNRDTANQDALRNLVSTSNTMGKITIAQYVEDAAAVSVLWSIGVNFIQGYFLQPPAESLDYDFSALG